MKNTQKNLFVTQLSDDNRSSNSQFENFDQQSESEKLFRKGY